MTGTFEEMIERCVHIVEKHEEAQRNQIENAIERAGL